MSLASHTAKRPRMDSTVSAEAARETVAAATTTIAAAAAAAEAPPSPLPEQDKQQIKEWIDLLPIDTVKIILGVAALQDPAVADSIRMNVEAVRQLERTRRISFDHFSKQAWHLLNRRGGGSREYEAGLDAATDIGAMFREILGSTSAHSSYETKFSAVETMRKMFKSTLLSSTHAASVARRNAEGWDGDFARALALFGYEEMETLVWSDDGEWLRKVEEVAALAARYGLFEGLAASLADLLRFRDEGEDSDEESDEDEYGGDEDGLGDEADDEEDSFD
ncbi:hypothetical protein BX600DRAFT_505101 [Xylariales sp. PMI_506]|nr:hypothetical protein BX600DRAFT_505101 [Xylariales sp. PMI_506]